MKFKCKMNFKDIQILCEGSQIEPITYYPISRSVKVLYLDSYKILNINSLKKLLLESISAPKKVTKNKSKKVTKIVSKEY